jgi:DNA-binding HxlR family transcriptional regulator
MSPTTTYRQYCPVAYGAAVLAARWTPLIVRELAAGATRFNEISQGLPGMSRTLLSSRLRELETNAIIDRDGDGYRLTAAGVALAGVVDALGRWGAQFGLGSPDASELDGSLLLWWMHRGIDHSRLPRDPEKLIVRFDFRESRDGSSQTMWLVLRNAQATVHRDDPGMANIIVDADLSAFYAVWVGKRALEDVVADGSVRFDGPARLVRAFRASLCLSPFAAAARTSLSARAPHTRRGRTRTRSVKH